jgi:hypothetical protein
MFSCSPNHSSQNKSGSYWDDRIGWDFSNKSQGSFDIEYMYVFFFFETGFQKSLSQASNLQLSCLSLLSAGITVMHHHSQI